jgi:hypothetical protein
LPNPPYTQFLEGQLALPAGGTQGSTVPAGIEWVIRDITVSSPNVTGRGFGGLAIADNNGYPIFSVPYGLAVGGRTYFYEGRQSIPAGSWLVYTAAEAGWSTRITGYVFVTNTAAVTRL